MGRGDLSMLVWPLGTRTLVPDVLFFCSTFHLITGAFHLLIGTD